MRVLVTTIPGTGPLHGMLPVVDALRAGGHDVLCCSAEPFRDEVEARGLTFAATGLRWHTSWPTYIDDLGAAAGGRRLPAGLVGPERLAWVTANLFIAGAARAMLPDLLAVAAAWRPDLILREWFEFAGCVAAERLALPHASVADGADSALDQRHIVAAALDVLRADVGLPPDPAGDAVYRHAHLCFGPARFDGPAAVHPATARWFRHDTAGRPVAEPAWLAELPDRPTVLVSMGTVFHRTPGVYEAVLDGLRDEPVNVLVALGQDADPARLGPLPANVRVEPYLPIPAVLRRADVFVTHGGFNSVKEAVLAGVPMVVVPISADQPYAAARCADLGVGVAVGAGERTAGRIRAAVREVLAGATFRRESARLRTEMLALPPAAEAVRLLEGLVAVPAR